MMVDFLMGASENIDQTKPKEFCMRFILSALLTLLIPCTLTAETVVVRLEDGTVLEIGNVPKGVKLSVKVLGKNEPVKVSFDPKKSVEKYLRENTNDASKLEILTISDPVNNNRCRVFRKEFEGYDLRGDDGAYSPVEIPGISVVAKFRAANAIGAKVLASKAFFFDNGGNITSIRDAIDVRYTVTAAMNVEKELEHMKEFFQLPGANFVTVEDGEVKGNMDKLAEYAKKRMEQSEKEAAKKKVK
jgi:hypothetical protein